MWDIRPRAAASKSARLTIRETGRSPAAPACGGSRVAAGRLRSKRVRPERPGASGGAPDLVDGREAQVRIEADVQRARRSPAAPEDSDDSIQDPAAAGAELFHPHGDRRRIDRGGLEIPGQGGPFRAASPSEQGG